MASGDAYISSLNLAIPFLHLLLPILLHVLDSRTPANMTRSGVGVRWTATMHRCRSSEYQDNGARIEQNKTKKERKRKTSAPSESLVTAKSAIDWTQLDLQNGR